jgi:hypothetical protein
LTPPTAYNTLPPGAVEYQTQIERYSYSTNNPQHPNYPLAWIYSAYDTYMEYGVRLADIYIAEKVDAKFFIELSKPPDPPVYGTPPDDWREAVYEYPPDLPPWAPVSGLTDVCGNTVDGIIEIEKAVNLGWEILFTLEKGNTPPLTPRVRYLRRFARMACKKALIDTNTDERIQFKGADLD